ncbi:GNAT family N-acetyltransferase [Oscillibacter sp. MSJ-2]|uniref:GNAT family N-acetyltransferase n=1 Tax=Dysosmobacter acutus TaxID=2841504 RepID=A0ABS6F8V6_9FIRM|nr:GNAT family N-acetyltransferase [Dysosmobacter acutus]
MVIREIREDKKRYLPLLLLADEQEDMIDRYLDRGRMYVLEEDGTKAVCVVTDEGDGILEIKNLAVEPPYQGRGYGRRLIEFAAQQYGGAFSTLQVGTGDSPLTIPFYEACGFSRSYLVSNFFTDHYDHPIFEGGKQLIDMVYLRRELHSDDGPA